MTSITTALAGLTALVMVMTAGSLTMLKTGGFETINSMSLFRWIGTTPIKNSWWLIISIACLALITLNTTFCSIQSLIKKAPVTSLLLKISPQIMHAGFLLIIFAHMLSSGDSFHFRTVVSDNQGIALSENSLALISGINLKTDSRGFPVGMQADVTIFENQVKKFTRKISPNHPAFYNGMGIYLKNAAMQPVRRALIEISHDSGAAWAFAGGILFFIGNILLATLKMKSERSRQEELKQKLLEFSKKRDREAG